MTFHDAMRWVAAALGTATSLGLAACAQQEPVSVVLITLDTTRADHLGAYGYARAHTPHFDRFAREGMVFDAVFCANSICTPASVQRSTRECPFQMPVNSASKLAKITRSNRPAHSSASNSSSCVPENLTTLVKRSLSR